MSDDTDDEEEFFSAVESGNNPVAFFIKAAEACGVEVTDEGAGQYYFDNVCENWEYQERPEGCNYIICSKCYIVLPISNDLIAEKQVIEDEASEDATDDDDDLTDFFERVKKGNR